MKPKMKLLQTKFAVPGSSAALALANDAAGLGLDWKTIALVVAASLGYALIEALVDIARIKAGRYGPEAAPAVPKA